MNLRSQNLGFESGDTEGWVYRLNGVIKTQLNICNSGLYVTKLNENVRNEIGQAAKFSEGER
ncbi:MAG: hypothetical protein Q8K70_04070 [Bacteroidota bacterium]|nr:hypothetical protein [Bacteroidota bacterium]